MNALDVVLVLAALVAVVGGWRLGLITRGLGWLGALIGGAVAVAVVPALNRWIAPGTDGGVLLLTAGAFILLISLGQALGVALGARIRPAPSSGGVRRFDALGGSALGLVGMVGLIWLLAPLMASTSGWVAAATRSSTLTRAVTDHLPPPPPSLQNLERSLANGNFPKLFADLVPAPDVPDAPEGSPITAEQLQRLAASAIKVQGESCSMVQSGSGFSVGAGLWVTNAHVVAGTSEVNLTTARGANGTGRTVMFDPELDLAIVHSAEVDAPALDLADDAAGAQGLVLGFPGGGEFDPSPFLVGDEITATGYDIYDRSLVRRHLLVLASELQPGDSGSAVVDADGAVVGVAVAVAPDRPGVAYALDATDVTERLSDARSEPVDTGPCI